MTSDLVGSFPALPGNGWTRSDWKTKPKTYYRDGWRTHQDDNHRGICDLDQITRDVIETFAVFGRVLKCQLRAENVKKDAAQGGGVDTDSPRSETQTDEGVRTFTQA